MFCCEIGMYQYIFLFSFYVDWNCRYFRYSPRRRPGIDTKYFTYGFAYIQDLVEQAIIKAHTGVGNITDKVGIYTQQFPYFCYTQDR